MTINPAIIREYDIRGIYNITLTDKDAYLIGSSLVSFLKEKNLHGKIAICRDGRLSSKSLAMNLKDGIIDQGYDVVDLEVGPTPMLYFSNFSIKDVVAGVMVTGSHNPPEYNGFKFIVDKQAFYGNQIKKLAEISSVLNVPAMGGYGDYQTNNIKDQYVDFLISKVKSDPNIKIVWDAGNGAAGEILESLARKLPGKHFLLNTQIDGRFPVHHPDPTVKENLQQLIKEVRNNNANFGVAFDGDGDRIGIVNKDGRIVWGDQILAILAKEVIDKLGEVSIIADIKSSKKLFDTISKLGGKPVMWKTGHSNIKTKMKELNSPLAGEMSGHIFYKDEYFGYDDALFAAIRLINCYVRDPKCIGNILSEFQEVVNTPEIRIQCDEKRKFQVIEEIKEYLTENKVKFNDTDGIRVDKELGWWLVRASNTQDILVVRVEGESRKTLEQLYQELKKLLRRFNIALPEINMDE